MGLCDGIANAVAPMPDAIRDKKVLFIPQGFEAIDQGVTSALERSVRWVRVAPAAEMLLQAQEFRPDLVLVLNGLHVFPPDHLTQIDAIRGLGIPTAIWFADDPYVTDQTVEIVPHYDYVFTHERTCVELYMSRGCPRVYHLPLAAYFDLYRPEQALPEYRTDICFIGNAFWNRVAVFDAIASYLKDKKVLINGIQWDRMSNYRMLAPFIRTGWMDIRETIRYYNGAKIVINLHRTPEARVDNANSLGWPAVSVNPRTFEIAACGAFQLTDLRPELPQHFAVGSEIATYQDAEQLISQLDYYLKHDEERLLVAARGYHRTLRNHAFPGRVRLLLDTIGL